MKCFKIGEKCVGEDFPCLIIAEIGINHNGDERMAMDMIDVIAESGADCVKFQSFSAKEFINNKDQIYKYESQGKSVTESMLDMFSRYELRRDQFERLFSYAKKRNLIVFSTPTDKFATDFLFEFDVPVYKIGSDDLVYHQLLEYIAIKNKPIIISTGMANLHEINCALDVIENAGNHNIAILHCVSLYPTPEDEINLKRISVLKKMFSFPIGYSDHSFGITAALGAVAFGANIIEKHFTLDRNLPGPDHRFSSDPNEFRELVKEIRRLEKSIGSGRFWPSEKEIKMSKDCRRSIVAGKTLSKGHIIIESDLAFRRPGKGMMPYEANKLIGLKTRRNIECGEFLEVSDMERD